MAYTYPTLAQKAIRQLLVFPSTWECKQGFSAMTSIKSKSQNCLTFPSYDFRCVVSAVTPRIKQLVRKKPTQPSY